MKFKVLVLLLVALLLLVTTAGCLTNYYCKYDIRLEFNGDVHKTAMYQELNNIGFNPRNNASGAVDFNPVCNDTQQIEKSDEQKVLGKIQSAYSIENDNDTSGSYHIGNWSIRIISYQTSENSDQMGIHYKHWTLCVKALLIEKITKDLNMTTKFEQSSGKCGAVPGFSGYLFIVAVPAVAFVLRTKRI